MIFVCLVCGTRGIAAHVEAGLLSHQMQAPDCPVNEAPLVITGDAKMFNPSGVGAEFTVAGFMPPDATIKV